MLTEENQIINQNDKKYPRKQFKKVKNSKIQVRYKIVQFSDRFLYETKIVNINTFYSRSKATSYLKLEALIL